MSNNIAGTVATRMFCYFDYTFLFITYNLPLDNYVCTCDDGVTTAPPVMQ